MVTVTVILSRDVIAPAFPLKRDAPNLPDDDELYLAIKVGDLWFLRRYLSLLSLDQLEMSLTGMNVLYKEAWSRSVLAELDRRLPIDLPCEKIPNKENTFWCERRSRTLSELQSSVMIRGKIGLFTLLSGHESQPVDQRRSQLIQAWYSKRLDLVGAVLPFVPHGDKVLDQILAGLYTGWNGDRRPEVLRPLVKLLVEHGGRNLDGIYTFHQEWNTEEQSIEEVRRAHLELDVVGTRRFCQELAAKYQIVLPDDVLPE